MATAENESLIAPSLLAAEFSDLRSEVNSVASAGADWLHLDVMDGNFVPNISFGMPVISSLRKITDLHFDVHAMINLPQRHIETFAKAGADALTIHIEAQQNDIEDTLKLIAKHNMRAGLAINPETSPDNIYPYLQYIDRIVVMTVNPGFGGQSYIDRSQHIHELSMRAPDHYIIVDGGINVRTAAQAKAAGANVFVAGTSIFGSDDRHDAIATLREAIRSE